MFRHVGRSGRGLGGLAGWGNGLSVLCLLLLGTCFLLPCPLGIDEESKAGAVCCAECSTVISSLNAVRQLLFSGRETAGTEIKPPAHSPSFRK